MLSAGMQPVRAAPATGDAFEDVLYGSESELGDSDDDDDGAAERRPAPRGKAAGARGARLRVDDDEPMDLLHGAGSKLTGACADTQTPRSRD
jgi:ribosomal RNA-processing protein 12